MPAVFTAISSDPIDARFSVETIDDLLDPDIFGNSDGYVYVYKGLQVFVRDVVLDDEGNTLEGGVFMFIGDGDESGIPVENLVIENWIKIATTRGLKGVFDDLPIRRDVGKDSAIINDKLNNIAKGKSSDYFGNRHDDVLGKRRLYKNIEKGKYKSTTQMYNQKYGPILDNEKEDTLWYKKPEILNVNKYITRIDVYISTEESFENNLEMFIEMKEKSDMLNIPIFFYDDLKDFDKQNNNILDIEKERI